MTGVQTCALPIYIQPDAEILEKVQEKVVSYLSTQEFVSAAAAQYGEDFPSALPLMVAKLTTLEKLQAGAEEKIQALNANVAAANVQYRKANALRPYTKLNIDLDDIRRQNEARRNGYDNYTKATTDSLARTRSYEIPAHTTVPSDNSFGWFEYMLIYHILHDHHDGHFTIGSGSKIGRAHV